MKFLKFITMISTKLWWFFSIKKKAKLDSFSPAILSVYSVRQYEEWRDEFFTLAILIIMELTFSWCSSMYHCSHFPHVAPVPTNQSELFISPSHPLRYLPWLDLMQRRPATALAASAAASAAGSSVVVVAAVVVIASVGKGMLSPESYSLYSYSLLVRETLGFREGSGSRESSEIIFLKFFRSAFYW